MTGATKRKAYAEPPFDVMARLHGAGFSLLPLGGGLNGKSPLTTFKDRPKLTLSQVLGPMRSKKSQCYGIRLGGFVVIDCDVDDPDLILELEARFGKSAFHGKTPRGRHLYYRHDGQGLPNLQAEGLPVDLKYGPNAYVMGPGSVRPDGGEYIAIQGDLASDSLTILAAPAVEIRQLSGAKQLPRSDVSRPGLIREGKRNKELCSEAIRMVAHVNDVDELAANLKSFCLDQCENPATVTDVEIAKITDWAWQRRLEGKLYAGRKSEFPVDRTALDALRGRSNSSDAIALYVGLLDAHGHVPARRFPLAHAAMRYAGHTDLSRRRFHAARDTLLEVGVLQVAQNHSAGKSKRTYRLVRLWTELPENVTELR